MRSMFGRACGSPALLFIVLTSVHASIYIVGRVSRIVRAGDVRAFHDWARVRLSSTFFIVWKHKTIAIFLQSFICFSLAAQVNRSEKK